MQFPLRPQVVSWFPEIGGLSLSAFGKIALPRAGSRQSSRISVFLPEPEPEPNGRRNLGLD